MYQEKLRQIQGFVAHYTTGPPPNLKIVIEPVQVDKPSAWFNPSTFSLHIQIILLTDLVSDAYREFIAEHEAFHINHPRASEKEAIEHSQHFLKERPFILTYDDPRSEEPAYAGGKCAKLAWAYRRGIPNPLGFTITIDVNRAYYQHNPELLEMIREVRNLDVTNATGRKAASEKIQHFMRTQTHLPAEIYQAIRKQVIRMSELLGYPRGQYVSLAYRGSGLIEDFEGKIPWFKKSI